MFSKNDDLREAVTRYEKMLLEHETIFFDSYQYEDIILYYLEYAKYAKAKQALEVALSQYPTASALRLLQVEGRGDSRRYPSRRALQCRDTCTAG